MLPETVGAHGVSDRLTARTASCVRRSFTSSAPSRHTRPMTDPFPNVFGAHTGSDTGHGVAEIQTPRHSIFQCKNYIMPFIGKINSCATCSHRASDRINISLYQCIQNIWYDIIWSCTWLEMRSLMMGAVMPHMGMILALISSLLPSRPCVFSELWVH